jgi:hypothetical protein
MGLKTNKISGSTAVVLVDSTSTTNVGMLSIFNIHSTDSVNVDLYLYDGSNNYYIFKNLNIPTGAGFVISGAEITFPRSTYSLYIKLSASDSAVDVLIRN